MLNLKTNDRVEIKQGSAKGETGTVVKVYTNTALIEFDEEFNRTAQTYKLVALKKV